MRIALVVGINYYKNGSSLHGCVNDAYEVKSVLERNDGGTVNFDCEIITGTGPAQAVTRGELKDKVKSLFSADADIALLYFAGHGYIDNSNGYMLASDAQRGDDGIPLSEIVTLANRSSAKNKIIILDSCHSGFAGAQPDNNEVAQISEGVTILSASTADQYASEENGHGVFTTLLVDALSGSAANLTGDITPGSVYAHIDQSLGAWEQRPVFKTNVKQFVSLRKSLAPIDVNDLRRIPELFPEAGFKFSLDPAYEPEIRGREDDMPPPDEDKVQIFSILQQYNRLNLLVPVDAPHMWYAAMESKSCRLTALGEHYRRLASKSRI